MSAAAMDVVLDTNVAMVANGDHEQASPECITACTDELGRIQNGEYILLVDDKSRIFQEYKKNLIPEGREGPGTEFFIWFLRNQANEHHCRHVPITPHNEREFEEFPDDPDLATFDMDDRMFVAVALASKSGPRVLNAVDTDWRDYREPLHRNGVEVEFLCPELMFASP